MSLPMEGYTPVRLRCSMNSSRSSTVTSAGSDARCAAKHGRRSYPARNAFAAAHTEAAGEEPGSALAPSPRLGL